MSNDRTSNSGVSQAPEPTSYVVEGNTYRELIAERDRLRVHLRQKSEQITRLQDSIEKMQQGSAERSAHEPPDCKQCDQLIGERDHACDALQETHIALGGDGEWVARSPSWPPPDSGDLHLDVPELARERMAELERLRASEPPLAVREMNADDAPVQYILSEAEAWAAGYNAAIDAQSIDKSHE